MQFYTTIGKQYIHHETIHTRKMYMGLPLSTTKPQPIRDWVTTYSSELVVTTDDVYVNTNQTLVRFDKKFLLNHVKLVPLEHHATTYPNNIIYDFVQCGNLLASKHTYEYFDGICWLGYGQQTTYPALYTFGGDDCYHITHTGRKRYLETMNPTFHSITDFAPMDDFTPLYATMYNGVLSMVTSNDLLFECNQITWDLRSMVVTSTDYIGEFMMEEMVSEYVVRWSHQGQIFMATIRGNVIMYDRAAAKWVSGKPILLTGGEYLESVGSC